MKSSESKRAASARYYAKNREKIAAKAKKNSEARKPRDKKYRETRSDNVHASHIKWRYGITKDEYNQLLKEQKNKCAICRKKETQVNKKGEVYRLCVDHDHVTGKVRGLLCFSCNKTLGHYETMDIPPLVAYLEKHK